VQQPWFTADVLRRAVAIPQGRHAVRWRYVMPGQRSAQALLVLGLAILAALGMMATRRRSSQR
jgi:LPXTG-motif cell wall-anchored protein